MKFVVAFLLVCAGLLPRLVSAHPLDVAYLDVGTASSSNLTLTVAIHPYQAFELVRHGSTDRFNLTTLQKSGALVTAYVADHVQISRDGNDCVWTPSDAHTPPTELEAVGDGVTIVGDLACPGTKLLLHMNSSLFVENFPTQTSILRLDLPDGYADRVTLDRMKQSGDLDITELFVSPAPGISTKDLAQNSINDFQESWRMPDGRITALAARLLDPGLGLWGFIVLLGAVAFLGMLHALGPGHGKALMAATLVGKDATLGKALILGTLMAATHVSDVFLMAILAGFLSAIIPPTALLRTLEIVSAAGLFTLGLAQFVRSIQKYRAAKQQPDAMALEADEHARAHALGLPHLHDHHHEHHEQSFREAMWLGFVGSLAPCPTAWAVFMATVSIGKISAAIFLLIAFAVGLHATILIIGILVVKSQQFAFRKTSTRFMYAMPMISAAVVTAIGAYLISRQF